ncbi:MAG: hypothetical protein HYZ85_04975 [Candidatus Omnitrophica bacterium]|nr:hypothetical protein [Candidatus Omnitrophota bacterium]
MKFHPKGLIRKAGQALFGFLAMKIFPWILMVCVLSGCASTQELLGTGKLKVPPEFHQKIILEVPDDYEMYQAPQSTYDVGDLQSFHVQHTFPVILEDAFREMFDEVEVREKSPHIETEAPEVPAVFEVRIMDVANDIFNEAETYRGQLTLAVAMKSPSGHIFWQKAFRGDGFVQVDPQFGTGLGPNDALVDALRNAVNQMQDAIINSPEVRLQMKYYLDIQKARQEKEVQV